MCTTTNVLNAPTHTAVLCVLWSIQLSSALHIRIFLALGTCPHWVRVHTLAHPVACVLKRYPEPHDHGGLYNRSPCAH